MSTEVQISKAWKTEAMFKGAGIIHTPQQLMSIDIRSHACIFMHTWIFMKMSPYGASTNPYPLVLSPLQPPSPCKVSISGEATHVEPMHGLHHYFFDSYIWFLLCGWIFPGVFHCNTSQGTNSLSMSLSDLSWSLPCTSILPGKYYPPLYLYWYWPVSVNTSIYLELLH